MADRNPAHHVPDLQNASTRRIQPASVTLRRLFGFVAPERGRLLVACAAMSLASVNNLAFPRLVAALIDNMSAGGRSGGLRRTLLGSLALFAAGGLGSWLRTFLFNTACESVARRLRKQMLEALMRQDMAYYDKHRVGDLMTRMADDVNVSASAATNNLAKGYRYANSAFGGSIILLLLSPRLTAISLAIVPLLGVSGMSYGLYARKLSKALKERASEVASRAEERLSNFAAVRLAAMELHEAAEYARLLDDTSPMARKAASAEGALMGGLAFAGFSSLMGVLCYGGTLVARKQLSVGALTSLSAPPPHHAAP
jgi:ABC-type multidrug transport system fused ATPase/permease subunit